MKKLTLLLSIISLSFISCEKNVPFEYSAVELCGRWNTVAIQKNDSATWVNVKDSLQYTYRFEFNENGMHQSENAYGVTTTGAYDTYGDCVQTYRRFENDKVKSVQYVIEYLYTYNVMEAKILDSTGNETQTIRAVKGEAHE